jgi:hypothetical protein
LKIKLKIRKKRDLQLFSLEQLATVPALEHAGVLGRPLHIKIENFALVLLLDDSIPFLAFGTRFSTY